MSALKLIDLQSARVLRHFDKQPVLDHRPFTSSRTLARVKEEVALAKARINFACLHIRWTSHIDLGAHDLELGMVVAIAITEEREQSRGADLAQEFHVLEHLQEVGCPSFGHCRLDLERYVRSHRISIL